MGENRIRLTNPENQSNQIGSGSNIFINMDEPVFAISEDGNYDQIPEPIVVGHELIHGAHIDLGEVEPGTADPNGPNYTPELGGSGDPMSNEEINTRIRENILRRELGFKTRRVSTEKNSGFNLRIIEIKLQEDD